MSDHHSRHQGTAPQADLSHMFTREFWDERYASSERIWSGQPNARFVEQVAGLTPGTAYDVGCGEGADAIWLATRGWTVTGLDVSQVALDRCAVHAAEQGVAPRTTWLQADLFAGDALPGRADLVTASFVHAPEDAFAPLYTRMADAVASGGHLLVLGHHPQDAHTGLRNSELSHLLFTPQQVTDLLDPAQWEVVSADTPTREHVHEGVPVAVTDTVVLARRR